MENAEAQALRKYAKQFPWLKLVQQEDGSQLLGCQTCMDDPTIKPRSAKDKFVCGSYRVGKYLYTRTFTEHQQTAKHQAAQKRLESSEPRTPQRCSAASSQTSPGSERRSESLAEASPSSSRAGSGTSPQSPRGGSMKRFMFNQLLSVYTALHQSLGSRRVRTYTVELRFCSWEDVCEALPVLMLYYNPAQSIHVRNEALPVLMLYYNQAQTSLHPKQGTTRNPLPPQPPAFPRPGTTKINLLSLNKLILDSLSAASPASSLATARNHQNQFVEPQQTDFGFPVCCLPSLQPSHDPEPPTSQPPALPRPGTTKINLLSLNKLILDSLCLLPPQPPVLPRPGTTKINLLSLNKLILDWSHGFKS